MKPADTAEQIYQTAVNSPAVLTAWEMVQHSPQTMLPYGYVRCAAEAEDMQSRKMKFGGMGDMELMAFYERAVSEGSVSHKEAADAMERISLFIDRWVHSRNTVRRQDWDVLKGSAVYSPNNSSIKLLKYYPASLAFHILVVIAATAELAPTTTASDIKTRSDAAKDALKKLFGDEKQFACYSSPSGSGALTDKEAVQAFNEAFRLFGLNS